MKDNFDICFENVIKHEGGFVNHPRDPGGMTNLGVTKSAIEDYLGREVDEQFMRSLTPATVRSFYKARYWDKMRCDDLPSGVDYAVFDFAVNSGVGRAAKFLQRVAGVEDDGIIGRRSVEAICAIDPEQMVVSLCDMRLMFLKSLSTFSTFGRGWERRIQEVSETGKDMVG